MQVNKVRWALSAAEAAGGAVGGLLLALPGTLLGRALGAGANNGFGDLIGAILVAALGYVVGTAAGVWLMGKRAQAPGALWAIALGSLAGGVLTLLLAQPLRLNETPWLLQATFMLLPPVLAAAAAQVTRRAVR
jgi:integral membrane sensor domain MASE1